jgi:hypothetical protein
MTKQREIVAASEASGRIERTILSVRGSRVVLDRDLAELYGVETKVLNQAVRRNVERFPATSCSKSRPRRPHV